MDIKIIVDMQKVLDGRILNEHKKMEQDTIRDRILALMVEIGELANETRCFKYWSLKPMSRRSVILEEYVDGIHFIVSLGNTIGHNFSDESFKVDATCSDPTQAFIKVFERITNFANDIHVSNFTSLWNEYLGLGKLLGFSANDIYEAYKQKNEVNHDRQDSGY